MVMTEENKNKTTISNAKNTRINRRSMLKAGAIVAPLAITLHGGIPMAHATSSGCVEDMETRITVPQFKLGEDGITFEVNHDLPALPFDPVSGITGRVIEGQNETHWDYIVNEELFGASCLQSFENTGLTVN